MKKIFFAIFGAAVLFAACSPQDFYMEQNPNRTIVEYTPSTFTMDAPGALTPDAAYDWITMNQSGNSATFTVRRNTTGLIRRAEYTIAGQSQKLIVNQKAHSLDAKLNNEVGGQSLGAVDILVSFDTGFGDDYESWGLLYSKGTDRASAKDVPQGKIPNIGKLFASVDGLEEGVDYYFWSYVVSSEGDKIYSPMLAVIPPVYVKEACNLQEVIDKAKEYQEIRILGGLQFGGGITIYNNNKNKSLSGGWNADFTEQSMDNLTVIDARGAGRGIVIASGEDDLGLDGYANISYFEIKNCVGNNGGAVHVVGGPVNVHHCYIHDNKCSEKGAAIGTRDGKVATVLNIYNNIITDNIADGGHSAGLGLGEGLDRDHPAVIVVANNLLARNLCMKFGGYAAEFIVYSNTDAIFVNNTMAFNFNYMDGDDMYQGIVLRGDAKCLFANNIIVGNTIAIDKQDPPVPFPHPNHVGVGGSASTFACNFIEGPLRSAENAIDKDNTYFDLGFDTTTIIDANFMPVGKAIDAGTTGTFTYKFKDRDATSASVASVLEKYNTDLAGNPRIVGGKVDMGCYEAQ